MNLHFLPNSLSYFLYLSLLTLPLPSLSQDTSSKLATSLKTQCLFSCPLSNTVSPKPWPLVKRAGAVGRDSYYTIFECVYAIPSSQSDLAISEWKCAYDKRSGLQSLPAAHDNCPPQALPCPSFSPSSSTHAGENTTPKDEPQFSNVEKVEVMSWVENGRFLLYLMEHHPGFDRVG